MNIMSVNYILVVKPCFICKQEKSDHDGNPKGEILEKEESKIMFSIPISYFSPLTVKASFSIIHTC
jgi:hypothetical protein